MAFCLLSHRSLLNGDDEPKTLPYANPSICSIGADAGQQFINKPYDIGDTQNRIEDAAMLLFLLPAMLFAFGSAMLAYPDFADRNGWPVGARYRNATSSLDIVAIGGMASAVVWAFTINPWWIAWYVIPVGFLIGLFFTVIVRHWIQVVAPIGILVLWSVGLLVPLV